MESFDGKLRDECPNREWFVTRREAKIVIEKWRQFYDRRKSPQDNNERPHCRARQSHTGPGRPETMAKSDCLNLKTYLLIDYKFLCQVSQPKQTVMVQSDQGTQFSSYDWQAFLKAQNLQQSMSRRGNCHDNAVAESFFQLLKRERVRRKIYSTREEARQDVFDYIGLFYNPRRCHGYTNRLSPIDYEKQYFARLASV